MRKITLTLPTDSKVRKDYPMATGCDEYFPAALAGVARHSFLAGARHTPGEPMHHKRGASMDHRDCIRRHMTDIADMIAAYDRAQAEAKHSGYNELIEAGYPDYMEGLAEAIIVEANALSWRALAYAQGLHELFAGAPLAPAARAECGMRDPNGTAVCARQFGHFGLHMGASMLAAQEKFNAETPPGETDEQRTERAKRANDEYEAHRGRGPLADDVNSSPECAACGRETPQAVAACDRWDCPQAPPSPAIMPAESTYRPELAARTPPSHTCAIGSTEPCAACDAVVPPPLNALDMPAFDPPGFDPAD